MLKQVILIEKTKFVYRLISSILGDNDVRCYCLDQLEDFSYLLEDLSPQVLLVDFATASQDWDLFWYGLNNSQYKDFKKILYGDQQELDHFEDKDSFDDILVKPIDVTQLYEYLKAL